MKRSWFSPVALLPLCACSSAPPTPAVDAGGSEVLTQPAAGKPSLLLFSRTAAFRHDSIPAGIQALTELAQQQGWGLTATEDAREFTDEKLAPFAAVIFLSTTGNVLDAQQQSAFERYFRADHGFVGIHAAADCEYDWPWYGELVGAYFTGHSDVVSADVKREAVEHTSTAHLPSPWNRRDEWYGFRSNVRGTAQVLLTVDEATFDPGPGAMGADHPIAWFRGFETGWTFYTGLGHTAESYADPAFRQHLIGGIEWAATRGL